MSAAPLSTKVSLGQRIWFALSSPHPYWLLSMAMGVLVNDAQFPKASLHWIMDAMLIFQGIGLAFVQWKADPNAPLTVAGNALIPQQPPPRPTPMTVVALSETGPAPS
jgi:hypothetical protein